MVQNLSNTLCYSSRSSLVIPISVTFCQISENKTRNLIGTPTLCFLLNSKIKPRTAMTTVSWAPIVYVDAFYVFGGNDYNIGALNAIGRLDNNNQWSRVGNLANARSSHGAVFIDGFFLVVGGDGEYQTEKCSLQEGAVSCTSQAPSLEYYTNYPELFLVSDSFCHI